ncbi:DUF2235 domain-containing protein [Celerinatantimonas diazotrophica]|uniref:Putative alpha/beta hydrolase family protein DUF2235 n=1 Tax=Celerinatantimonas diazotrophica TaxID=412034 RepID=A0A4R1K4U7_9GAMM|nr:DUF2235 domain-containing protein [Celerinatantimonas diazotrophica]TCK58957.1 putative alpha/beta hydrolase family protein DUF2235 [Celerinatantimonas diazotrophica]CAG9297591.1 hypothetical protein CEDIAZO_02779 [Celerinatantimonas diazotrophica]
MKNIICCCDGTWDRLDQETGDILSPTNVVRIYNALSPVDDHGTQQVKYYHPGVGTGHSIKQKLLGGGLGEGINRNIKSAYRFLCENYQEGDHIYLYGFSRGAYTVRCLAGFITKCGLLKTKQLDDSDIWHKIDKAFSLGYRKNQPLANWSSNGEFTTNIEIFFIGVWDTVGSLGIPDEMGILKLFDNPQKYYFYNTQLSKNIKHARQALSIDEKRKTFQPTLWDETQAKQDHVDLVQKWFPGVHTDVGGGYPETGLSDCTLIWMIRESEATNLNFELKMTEQIHPNSLAPRHDSCTGIFKLLETRPRSIPNFISESSQYSEFALARYSTPPISDAPYHLNHTIYPQGTSMSIYADQQWNETGIWLEKGKHYSFQAIGTWKDNNLIYDANGKSDHKFHFQKIVHCIMSAIGKLKSLLKKLERNPSAYIPGTKRNEKSPWFSLIGSVACNLKPANNPHLLGNHETFLIGNRLDDFTPQKSGYFYAYANDAWNFYFNNHGSVRLEIKIKE